MEQRLEIEGKEEKIGKEGEKRSSRRSTIEIQMLEKNEKKAKFQKRSEKSTVEQNWRKKRKKGIKLPQIKANTLVLEGEME